MVSPGVSADAPGEAEAMEGQAPAGRLGLAWLVALMAANTIAAVGLFGDIARHVSQPEVLDAADFLSGWHLVLYGGVTGVALVLGALAVQRGPRAPLERLPTAAYGLGTLCVGGLTDALWHEAFGVEAAFRALVSPPHLLILLGLVLLMVAPIGALARGRGELLDGVESVVLALSVTSLLLVVSLFTGYLTPLIGGSELQAGTYVEPLIGTSIADYDVARGLAVGLWFSALVSLTVVVVRARMAPVAGTWTIAFGFLGVAPLVANGEVAAPLTIGLVVLGLATDLVATRSRPHPLLTGAAVAAMWGALFAVVDRRGDLVWERELWTGVVATGFLVGAAVGAAARWLTVVPRAERRG